MKKRHIKSSFLYIAFTLLVVVFGTMTLVSLNHLHSGLGSMQATTEEYIESQQAVSSMREASDFLTMQSREYVVNGDPVNLRAYLEEINETKRRDNALEVLAKYQPEGTAYQQLMTAVESSNALAEVEMYAMRMTSEGYEMSETELENYFPDTELTDEDRALSLEEKKAKAISMMFDENYTEMKHVIMNNSYSSLEELIGMTRDRQVTSYEATTGQVTRVVRVTIMILLVALAMLIINTLLVLTPMTRSVSYIRKHEPLPLKGVAEYVYLADAYNQMLERTAEHQEKLSYEASHDELTDLYNRKMFEEMRLELVDKGIAMLLIDVDYFKSINDTYGHGVGDDVLKNVAAILAHSFRMEDYVSRIGGDEFAVIMRHMDSSLQHVVEAKIRHVREVLAATEGLPAVTLSIGVAFSEKGNREDVYHKADLALYDVKDRGRNGYAFYEPWMSEKESAGKAQKPGNMPAES
ncbi:MAG: GGDEF domain-containing protein [Eubacterium sp.]|nr:GGDEF domain-containing protein [Eubacterium sp.]